MLHPARDPALRELLRESNMIVIGIAIICGLVVCKLAIFGIENAGFWLKTAIFIGLYFLLLKLTIAPRDADGYGAVLIIYTGLFIWLLNKNALGWWSACFLAIGFGFSVYAYQAIRIVENILELEREKNASQEAKARE
ncbi:MAG: hypothetical protein EYC62_06485 [Alphaproteobacteria bacterium]|nr:MAG: hypothetical protein EYC62_06485 [Alphaproteobacteria bacterium]